MAKKHLKEISKALLWAGGLNIGAVGLFDYNILYQVFSAWPVVLKLIYLSIGSAAVYSIADQNK